MRQKASWICRFVAAAATILAMLSTLGCKTEAEAPAPPEVTVPAVPVSSPGMPTVDEYWANAIQEVYKSAIELNAQHQAELARGAHYAKLMNGDKNRREIAITFDDGPHAQYTPQLLHILNRYHVRASFFVVGEKAELTPGLVRAEFSAGHSVGNHTYHHVNLTRIPARMVATEITACGDVIRSITGKECHLFRPPGGDYNQVVAATANGLGYTMILWTDDPGDYASPGSTVIVDRTLDRVRNGGIILLHDGVQQTVDVLPQILHTLQKHGFKFVTTDEMMRGKCNTR